MNVRQLLEAFDGWSRAGADLVLATVYDTSGSTYSKAGAQMLIDGAGHFQGMLSGGCLEGDLAERAAATLASGTPQAVTYDLGSSDEELWGLGVGCDGLMRIFLQPLAAAAGHEPFTTMAEIYRGDTAGAAATVIESAAPGLPPGRTLVVDAGGEPGGNADDGFGELAAAGLAGVLGGGPPTLERLRHDGAEVTLLVAPLTPPPRILVLGGGLDAIPVVRMIRELGWRVTLQDHRPAYIARGGFEDADKVLNLPPAEVATALGADRYDAAIIMSHHLQTDRQYLELLATTDIGYVGLLGPPARRRRLLAELGDRGKALAGRLHGPAGLDLGGRGPAAIALSILAELHQALFGPAAR